MKRRESLKALTLSSFGIAAVNPQELLSEQRDLQKAMAAEEVEIPGGRTKEEAVYDAKLMSETFFTPAELTTLTVLSDIIIPADEKSGSASQSGVPQFIEFMVKDQPRWQTPFRGGLRWLDLESQKRFGKIFTKCTSKEQLQIVDDIAYPSTAKPEMSQGVAFFNTMRNFTATGFFSSEIGIKDIGYMGNTPNQWDGVPADVLKQYGLSYD
ncbi:gluconate 2-dehydrogenase subunit 3 family protein [Arundinibacter roseus]|uniref:Gluconate 2-dehydrogenase subunit 3 family protein n=1 Tax=Arundinibacter roseus TaxID=2070510 RepID=A0A4R4K9W8_9BACT|nr:gluconate 2-dehydrogenase subunit 3 family protein [Arundinibacter roseus]TDB64520.1 gluconate 2-dehydrogenase subunit 3 family protein [Arundinibacter roseus]